MKTGEPRQAEVEVVWCGGGRRLPSGHGWLAQYLNASDKQKNTPGLFRRKQTLWSTNKKVLARNSCKCHVLSKGDVPVLPASVSNTVGLVSSAYSSQLDVMWQALIEHRAVGGNICSRAAIYVYGLDTQPQQTTESLSDWMLQTFMMMKFIGTMALTGKHKWQRLRRHFSLQYFNLETLLKDIKILSLEYTNWKLGWYPVEGIDSQPVIRTIIIHEYRKQSGQ